MCGRLSLADEVPWKSFRKMLTFEMTPPVRWKPSYNVAPSQVLLAIANAPNRRLCEFTWGLIPHWAKDIRIGNKMINARAETVDEKPAFRDAFKHRRCLILADGFYEWKTRESGGKQPYRIVPSDEPVFAFAGLWEEWVSEIGEVIQSTTIITTTPNDAMRPIHNRMPVIIAPAHYEEWLDPNITQGPSLKQFLVPYDPSRMTVYPVSSAVNNPRVDGVECARRDDSGG